MKRDGARLGRCGGEIDGKEKVAATGGERTKGGKFQATEFFKLNSFLGRSARVISRGAYHGFGASKVDSLRLTVRRKELKIFRLDLNFSTRCRKRASAHETTFFYADKGRRFALSSSPCFRLSSSEKEDFNRTFARLTPNHDRKISLNFLEMNPHYRTNIYQAILILSSCI